MGQTVELSKDELDNYGVIISHSVPDTYDDVQIKINEIVDNGVRYIHSNLIEPLQATKGFNIAKLKSRETSTSRSLRTKLPKYNLYALKINDFDDLLKRAENHQENDEDFNDLPEYHIDKSLFFINLLSPANNNKLEALYKLLKHIYENGLYYYQSNSYNNQNSAKLYINELRKVKYEYLILRSADGHYYINILLSELLVSFTEFKQRFSNLNFDDLKICSLAKQKYTAIYERTDILNFNSIVKTDRPFVQELIYRFVGRFLSDAHDYKKRNLLNKHIFNIDLIELFQKAIFSVDKKNIYFIKDDVTEFLKTRDNKILSITYNLTTNVYLKEQQIFTD
jgi:hypothetical protein